MKSSYIQNLGTGLAIFGAFAFSGWLLAGLDSLESVQSKRPGKSEGSITKRYEVPETEHMIPLIEEDYFFDPGQPPGMGAFYEDIMGGKGELGRVTVPANEKGFYFIFTKRGTVC